MLSKYSESLEPYFTSKKFSTKNTGSKWNQTYRNKISVVSILTMCKEYAPMIFELALAERMILQVQFSDNQQQSNNHKNEEPYFGH